MADDHWPPPDLRFVMSAVSSDELRKALTDNGIEPPRTQAEALVAALRAGPAVLRPVYLQHRLGGRAAVTWFRKGTRPSPQQIASLPRMRRLGEEIADQPYALVWQETRDNALAVRLAYVDGVDVNQNFEIEQRLAFATLVWRRLKAGRHTYDVLEVHCKSPKIGKVVFPALASLGHSLDLEVLDIRSNDHEEAIRAAFKARLTDAIARVDNPAAAEGQARLSAKRGRDLAEPQSEFRKSFALYPGRGRTIETDTLKFIISQLDFSTVFPHTTQQATAAVFEQAAKVGGWIRYE